MDLEARFRAFVSQQQVRTGMAMKAATTDRLIDFQDLDYTAGAGQRVSVKADGTGLELVPPSDTSWGEIGGTLADQADLQTALDAKQPLDADLTALAARTITPFGLTLLELADGPALRTAAGLNEGTFTPSLLFTNDEGTDPAYSPTNGQLGRYAQFGPLVFFQARLILTSKGTSTGAASVETSGLPTAAATPGSTGLIRANNMATVAVPVWLNLPSAASFSLFDFTASASTALTDADFNNNSQLIFSGVYFA